MNQTFSTTESNRVLLLLSICECDGQSKISRWDEDWNSVLWGFRLALSFYQGIILSVSVVRALKHFCFSEMSRLLGTFQSLDNGHSKKHPERKDGFMSRQGFGNELKPLHVCIFTRGSRWTQTNGSTEGGWWDGSGAVKPRWFAIKYKLMEWSFRILTGTRDS